MPVADLKDWAAEGDVEEGFHRGSQRGAPRHHKSDPSAKSGLHCLQHCAVYKGAQLHTVRNTFRCLFSTVRSIRGLNCTQYEIHSDACCAFFRLVTDAGPGQPGITLGFSVN